MFNCIYCGKEKKRGYDKRQKYLYCSRTCYANHKISQSKNATCLECKTKFHAKPSVLAKGAGKYCSVKCLRKHKWDLMKGKETYKERALIRNSPEYKRWRLEVLKEHNYKCDDCGKMSGSRCECCGHRTYLHVHHIKSFSGNKELRFDIDNSKVYCDKCHLSKHSVNKDGVNSVKTCLFCNEVICGMPNYVRKRKFCSNECYQEYSRQRRASKENNERSPGRV